jgi:beta-lactam-binding protein with PASTA domain
MGDFFRFLFSRYFLINLIIALLLISGLIYFSLRYLKDYTLHGKTLEVPELIGKHLTEAAEGIDGNQYKLLVLDSLYKQGVAANTILEQNPDPGAIVKPGRKIYLTLAATAPPQVTMPELIDLSLRQATALMETYGLEPGKLIYTPDICTNCILEQQYKGKQIEGGTKIARGSVIDLVVGEGLSVELVQVPYVLELTAHMANEVLKTHSLNIGSLNYDETVVNSLDSVNAIIYRQNPQYSDEPSVNMGSSVDLFLTTDSTKVVHSTEAEE